MPVTYHVDGAGEAGCASEGKEAVYAVIEEKKTSGLYMRTLGGFSIYWNGKLIVGGARSREFQFASLMQYLLHSGREGVERDRLEEMLFGDREIVNVHHTMQSVVYNAKQKLKKLGLPDVNYIELRKGTFYWTEQIPVTEDAVEFERAYLEAEAEPDAKKRMQDYLAACHLYTGEFLPSQGGMLWAAQEARRYRAMFCECMEKVQPLLRREQEYFQMRELGLYAASVQPLSDWETVTMEALVALGRYEEARKLYEDTVDYYFLEQGLRPSNRMLELLHRLGSQLSYQYAVLDDIQEELTDPEADSTGGYLCPYPVFQGVYRMVERMMERGGQSVYLMLCTVVNSKGSPMREGPILDELAERLEGAIRRSVRRSDAICRYGKGQYLVLLINTSRENCSVVQKRINYHFLVGRQRTGIHYYVKNVFCETGTEPQRKAT